ncbi:MAG: hypothetical protein JO027_07445 [Solirubrobacterales bacterium]|nr:hypothetical protein [Solirubrobacterales bacterium]
MLTTPIRELDHRSSDGIDVRLLWNACNDRISVAVHDQRLDEAFVLEVPGADAREAFNHPYAYARAKRHDRPLAA